MGLPKMVPTGVGQYFVVRTGKRESRRAVGMWVKRVGKQSAKKSMEE